MRKLWKGFLAAMAILLLIYVIYNLYSNESKSVDVSETKLIDSEQKIAFEKQLYERQIFATGKPRVFKTDQDIKVSRGELERYSERYKQALVGYFVSSSKSKFYTNKRFPGGGYYVVDFYIEQNLKEPSEYRKTIKVKLPTQFFKLDDKKYLDEIYSAVQDIGGAVVMKSQLHKKGEITDEELEASKKKMDADIAPYSYVYNYRLRIQRGSDFSLRKDNKLVLFLRRAKPIDGSYEFHPNHLFSLGKGTFVDVLLLDKNK